MKRTERTKNSAHLLFDFLSSHLNVGFTIGELCAALGVRSISRDALVYARELATEAGLHFPPAVPQSEFRYMVTNDPENAIDPTISMGLIASGVRRREQVGMEFLAREEGHLSPETRPLVRAQLAMNDTFNRAIDNLADVREQMNRDMAQVRREQRNPSESAPQ